MTVTIDETASLGDPLQPCRSERGGLFEETHVRFPSRFLATGQGFGNLQP